MPSRFEAFGIVFAEALANGVPCIGRNAYAMPEIIRHGDNGYLLDEHAEGTEAIKTLAVFILTILEDENMQKKVRLQSKETVAYFSWNRVSSQMVNTLRREV
jgi:glycosyltransferase involved in cell wall biosynthesis